MVRGAAMGIDLDKRADVQSLKPSQGVNTGDKEVSTKQIEVKAGPASDVKIYANGANQSVNAVDNSDNSVGKTNKIGNKNFGESIFDKINKNSQLLNQKRNPSIFCFAEKEDKPFGNFDIDGNGKLDDAELAAMQAYINSQKAEKQKKQQKGNPLEELLKVLGLGIQIGKILSDKENEQKINGVNETQGSNILNNNQADDKAEKYFEEVA